MDSSQVDARIAGVTAEARALLWVISRAREAITERLIERIWGGESLEQEMLRKLSAELSGLPPELRAQIEAQLPAEVLVQMNTSPTARAAPAPGSGPPPVGPLLAELVRAGLAGREGEDDDAPLRVSAEVTDRITAWMDQRPDERGGRSEATVLRTLGERYLGAFEALAEGDEGARDLAAETGQRAIRYLVRCGHQALGSIAAQMLASAPEEPLRGAILGALGAAAEEAPAGPSRWNARAAIADGVAEAAVGDKAGSDRALSLYERSIDEAEDAGAPSDLRDATEIGRRWASALERGGHGETARYAFRRSANNAKRAGSPRAEGIALELENARLGLRPGADLDPLAETVHGLIEELRTLGEGAGEGAAAVAEGERTARVLSRAYELGAQLDMAMDRWEPALERLNAQEALLRERGEGDHALSLVRAQRYLPLVRLGRLDEAEALLRAALEVFEEVSDGPAAVGTRSRLADLWDERGDHVQAVAAAREALRASEHVESVEMRAGCHENLSTYLEKVGDAEGALDHQVADLVYRVVARLDMGRALRTLSFDVLRATARGARHALPRLTALLEKKDFEGLRRFLSEREVPLAGLQQGIDELLATVQAGTKPSA